MTYEKFSEIMNRHLFQNEKLRLLEKIAEEPYRFVGVYRSTTPILKLQQFILQSKEIRFGNGMEEVIEKFLEDMNFIMMPNKNIIGTKNKKLNIDQYFFDSFTFDIYFVEQKVRDDHDSTKKRGQIENFKKKYKILKKEHGKITGIMYFIDPCLSKNKNYYIEKLNDFPEDTVYLTYGKEFFSFFQREELYFQLEDYLKRWCDTLPKEIILNFDETAEESFKELKNLELKYWEKLISNEEIWKKGIMKTLFPTSYILKKLIYYFKNLNETKFSKNNIKRYNKLSLDLCEKIKKYYN